MLKLTPDGTLRRIAGTGGFGFSGDGGPAIDAQMKSPNAMALGPDGSIYISDEQNFRIRRVSPSGIITTIAGTGTWPASVPAGADGDLAIETPINGAQAMAVGPDNTLYFCELTGSGGGSAPVIRSITPDGRIAKVTGGPLPGGFAGDGGPAEDARFKGIADIALHPDGSLYIADSLNHRLRRVRTDGIVETVAGTGSEEDYTEGAAAIDSPLYRPTGLAISPSGKILVYQEQGTRPKRISSITPGGNLIREVGRVWGGDLNCNAEGTPPRDWCLKGNVKGMSCAPDGTIYFASPIKKVSPAMPPYSTAEFFVPDPAGGVLYHFDALGRHVRTLDTMLGTVLYEFEYDSFGRLVDITDGDGNHTAIERDGRGTARAIVGPYGHRTELAVRDGYLEELIDPAGSTYGITYEEGLMKTFADPEGNVTGFSYNEDGYLTKEEDPLGGSTTLSRWQDSGRCIVTRTSGLGEIWTYDVNRLESGIIETCNTEPGGGNMNAVLDPAGLTTISYPDGSTVSQQTQPDPRFGMSVPILETETITTPLGVATTTSLTRNTVLSNPFDALSIETQDDVLNVNGSTVYMNFSAEDREYSVITPAGRRVTYLHDEQGRLVEETFPSSGIAAIQYEYDARGRLARLLQGSQQWAFGLDDLGRLTTFDDAAGRRVIYEHDDADRQTRLILPSGRTYGFAYNANGDLVQLTMPNGMLHHFGRTPSGSFVTYHMPDGHMYTTLYDIDQQRESVTLPMDDTESFTYDASGNIQTISYPEATVQFTYGGTSSSCCICGDGQMTITRTPVSGAAQTLELAYDGHLLIGTSFSGAANARYTFAYDNDYDPVSIALEGADATAVAFNDDGELTTYGPFTFRRNGPVGSVDRIGDGVLELNYTYDEYGRVAARSHIVNGVNVYTLQSTYDQVDNLLSKTEAKAGLAETIRYTYNADGELRTVTRNSAPAEEYDYDLNRNRSSASRNGAGAETATYDSLDRLTGRGAVSYQLDDDGCLVSRGADTFTYSTRGELLQAQFGGGRTIAYTYDGFGRLVARTDDTGTRQYLYDGLGSVFLVTEFRDTAGELTRLYYDDYGHLYAMRQGAAWFYVACDQVGTPQIVADATGAVVKQMTWDSFGNLLSDSNPSMFMPLGFAGGIVDPDVGLVRFGLRDYEPASGRWTARDAALFQGGSNLYAYAFNDPVNRRDPTGLFCVSYGGFAIVGMEFGLCVTGDGFSICGEAGFGLGGGLGVDPFGGLAAEELFLNAELTGNVGVASGGYAGHWGTCGSSHGPRCQLGSVNFCERKANLDSGNFNRTAGDALRRDYRHTRGSFRQAGQHIRDRNLRGLFGARRGAIRAQGKLTGGACGQVLW